jgi:hypothetical protein
MKRLIMALAIAVAVNFTGFGVQTASANDAHHPAAQATKGKKVKKAMPTKKSKRSGMQMHCPMMAGGMMHGGMMKGGMMNGGMMQHQGKMKCPMMSAGGARPMGMMHGASSHMNSDGMRHGEVMMGHRNPCWVMTDRDRGLGYQGACTP